MKGGGRRGGQQAIARKNNLIEHTIINSYKKSPPLSPLFNFAYMNKRIKGVVGGGEVNIYSPQPRAG